MNAAFEALFTQHGMSSYAKQTALLDATDVNKPWHVNMKQGTLLLGGKTFHAGVLGSYNPDDQSWLWCWANPSMECFPARVTDIARQLQDYGERHDIPLLRDEATFDISVDDCHRLAMVAVGMASSSPPVECSAYFVGPGTHQGGGSGPLIFLTIQERPPLDVELERFSFFRINHVITFCVTNFSFEGTHREAVLSYFESDGVILASFAESADDESNRIVAICREGHIVIAFNEHGRVTKVSGVLGGGGPLAPSPNRWWCWCC